MAVSTTNAVSGPYVANGSTIAFPFTFKCLTAEEVRVTITVAAVETEESTSSYSVTLNTGGDGGTITFDVAPATGDVRIYSEPEFTQETGFASGQAFSPSVVNEALDRAAVRDQYILRKINALLDEFDTGIVGDIRSDLASTASGKGAYLVSSAAIVARPEDYGAVANGTSDDSAAFTSAITARRNVKLAAGKSYAFKDIVLSNSQSIDGTETILKGYTGGANLLTLKDYGSKFSNAYANDGLSLSGPYIKVLGGRFTKIESLTLTNAKNGAISLEPTGVTHSDVGSVSDLSVEGVETTAINISSSVSTWNFDNLYLDGKLVDTGSGLESTTGSVGWRQNTPVVSGLAVGGHNINNVTMLNFDTGIYMTDAQLTKFSNMAVDSCGGYGIKIDGSSYHIDFADLFVGYTAGIYVGGTAVVNIDGLRTNGNGVIPTWGSATFYHVSGPYYDVNVNNTASLTIANWRGPKTINVASGAKLIVLDGVTYEGKSVGTVAAATTTYLGAQGQSTTEADVQWRAPYDCYLLRISATVVAAPSAGQSFTYTARINGTNTALTQTITDTSFGGLDAWAGTAILVTKGQTLSIKLDTSAAAVATRHNCLMQVAPR